MSDHALIVLLIRDPNVPHHASGATVRDFRIVTKDGTTTSKSVFFSTDGNCEYGCGLNRGLTEWRVTGMVFDQGMAGPCVVPTCTCHVVDIVNGRHPFSAVHWSQTR